ncbi:MAG TPA: hypothetical protein VGD04_01375, partial [Methylophilus sp.]
EIDRLIPRYWYWYIRSRTEMNDGELDILFAEDANGEKYDMAGRPTMFESIRVKGNTPSNGSHPLRKFSLIDKVDNHPSFNGSKKIFTSPFWDLIQSNPIDLKKNNEILELSFERLNLTRLAIDHKYFGDFMNAPVNPKKRKGISRYHISEFEHSFNLAISNIPDNLDLLALIGALYRESCLTFQLNNANVLSNYFQMVSDSCLNTEWENPAGALLWDIAHERILYGNFEYVTSMRDENNIYKNIPKSFGVIVNKLDQRFKDRFG